MKLGILETGAPPEPLIGRFGRYPAMFGRLLGDGFKLTSFAVTTGEFPAAAEDQDAYLITGSPAGVYEDHPWIPPLIGFLRSARGKAGLVGICFGHQIMAAAFGGHVVKSAKGWGIGLQSYDVVHRLPWMDGAERISVPASHQDQVVVQPPGTRILAASAFTPLAALAYGDQPAISFQFHPEFTPDFARALIDRRRDRFSDAEAAAATLDRPNDSDRVGRWIRTFLAR